MQHNLGYRPPHATMISSSVAPLPLMPTIILSPRGKFGLEPQFWYIEPGIGDGIVVEQNRHGQVLRLSTEEWIAYRRRARRAGILDLRDTVLHEAGHAIAAFALGWRVDLVSVFPIVDGPGISYGRTTLGPRAVDEDPEIEAMRRAVVALAGSAADRRSGRPHIPGGDRDREEIQELLGALFPGRSSFRRRLAKRAKELAGRLVDATWPSVRELSHLLLQRLEANGLEVAASIHHLSQRRRRLVERVIADIGQG